jgi:hypothetical protein
MQAIQGVDKKMKRKNRSAIFIRTFLVLMMIVISGCSSSALIRIRDGVQPVLPVVGVPERQARVYQEISLSEQQRQQAYVQIIGGDIELPPSAGADKTTEQRTYDFYVWINAPSIVDFKYALQNGDLSIDVLNAKAKIEEVTYGSFGSQGISSSPITLEEIKSGKVARVSVESKDITQSFTITVQLGALAAEYESKRGSDFEILRSEYKEKKRKCEKVIACKNIMNEGKESDRNGNSPPREAGEVEYAEYIASAKKLERYSKEENPYLATKVVRVFNGDLHTQVYMLSDAETRDAFGTNFARYFYVGKAYFRNRHSDMKLIVNTTSLRAKTLFYRAPSAVDSSKMAERYSYLNDFSDRQVKVNPYLTVAQKKRIYSRVMQQEIRNRDASHDYEVADEIASEFENFFEKEQLGTMHGIEDSENKRILQNEIMAMVIDIRRAIRDTELQCNVGNENREYIYLLFSEGDYELNEGDAKLQPQNNANYEKQKKCFVDKIPQRFDTINSRTESPSPIKIDGRRRVGLTDKLAASSQDVYWQLELNRSGYVWEDYYRPMTLEAVLISLAAKTRSHPNNRAIDYLQSIGVVAGALVGMDKISSVFGGEAFAQRVAVTTGVFMPEVRKLLMRDLDQYLANLASTALPSILSLGPNESRDGYVFFPRGPIYGYGVDEFSLEDPSYIRNVDNDDVAVDGALIEAEKQFSAGQKSAEALVGTARSTGQAKVSEDMMKLADLEGKYRALRVRNLVNEICEMIASNKGTVAASYLRNLSDPQKQNQTIVDLIARAEANIACDKPLPVSEKK